MTSSARGFGGRGLAIALLAAVLAFGGAFVATRAAGGDGDEPAAKPVRELPQRLVTINNLERAPSIKPLRSIEGEDPSAPAAGAPAATAPAVP